MPIRITPENDGLSIGSYVVRPLGGKTVLPVYSGVVERRYRNGRRAVVTLHITKSESRTTLFYADSSSARSPLSWDGASNLFTLESETGVFEEKTFTRDVADDVGGGFDNLDVIHKLLQTMYRTIQGNSQIRRSTYPQDVVREVQRPDVLGKGNQNLSYIIEQLDSIFPREDSKPVKRTPTVAAAKA